jgi:monooxygenase
MLQRSPTYIASWPDQDPIVAKLGWMPQDKAYTVIRWKNVVAQVAIYQLCQRFPQQMRKTLMGLVKRQLPKGYDVDKHFGPRYNPWDQRLCVVPNGDLFHAISKGKVDVVTDNIDRFTETGILLASGRELPADVIVTATGLDLQLFGGATATVDGKEVDVTQTMAYKGMMLSGLPNMAYTVGYINIGWTLKADLVSAFVCRLLNYMDHNGFDTVVPERPGPDVDERPFMDSTSGYVLRKLHELPKQGSRKPWRLGQNYLLDVRLIRHGKVADEGLRFGKKPVALAALRPQTAFGEVSTGGAAYRWRVQDGVTSELRHQRHQYREEPGQYSH